MSDESDVEKTEEPTPQRLAKAREEGQIPRSKELTSVLLLLVGWCLISWAGSYLAGHMSQLLQSGMTFDRQVMLDPKIMLLRVGDLLKMALFTVMPILLGLFFTALASPTLLGGLLLSGKSLKVDIKRLSPLSGLKRMFSAQALAELLKSILKVVLAGCACTLFIVDNTSHFIRLTHQSPGIAIHQGLQLLSQCLLLVILAIIPMVGYDIFHQLTSHTRKLRMSRQEIRDEFKQQEGDPHVKGHIKQLQRTMARQRMMDDIPRADVIINNPTHYSIALSYQEEAMNAPVMLAKGAGDIALRIREEATRHGIPMLEAPPLARALYRHCEIGQPIPTALYSAVAEVLAWVFSLKRWRSGHSSAPKKPENIPVPAALDFAQESQD